VIKILKKLTVVALFTGTMLCQAKELWKFLPVPELGGLTGEEFFAYLEKNRPKSVLDLNPLFKRNGFGQTWTAVTESQSDKRDLISAENPRVIAIEDTTIQSTLNGDGGMPRVLDPFAHFGIGFGPCSGSKIADGVDSSRVLETFTFQPDTLSFVLREVTLAQNGQAPLISEPNPERCLGCHNRDPRPIVETYNFWPGWIGSVGRAGVEYFAINSIEAAHSKTAYERIRENKNFDFLPWHSGEIPEYLGVGTSEDLASDGLEITTHSAYFDPNARITEGFSQSNRLRVARVFLSNIENRPDRHKILELILDPGPDVADILRVFPDIAMDQSPTKVPLSFPEFDSKRMSDFNRVRRQVDRLNLIPFGLTTERGVSLSPEDPQLLEGKSFDLWRFLVVAQALGVGTVQLSTSQTQALNFIGPQRPFIEGLGELIQTAYAKHSADTKKCGIY
jgi:hypothetical protein